MTTGGAFGCTPWLGALPSVEGRWVKPRSASPWSWSGTGNAGTGYSHDAQCVTYEGPDTEHRGRQICLGANETSLSIADVTDKANPIALDRGEEFPGWQVSDAAGDQFTILNHADRECIERKPEDMPGGHRHLRDIIQIGSGLLDKLRQGSGVIRRINRIDNSCERGSPVQITDLLAQDIHPGFGILQAGERSLFSYLVDM